MLMDRFRDARLSLSNDLTALNEESVMEITEGLRSVIRVRDRTEELVAAAPEGQCATDATQNWSQDLTDIGAAISQCADQHVDPIYERTEAFHLYIQVQNRLAFNVQNMVLSVFTDLNPLISAAEITPVVMEQIDDILTEFTTVVNPEIVRMLGEISSMRQSIPQEVHSCVNDAMIGFNEVALAIQEAVSAC